jgi:hypothetical protein
MSLIPFAGAVQKFNRSGGGGATGYQIERSLRFNSADSAYLNRTPASAGNRKTWTWSAWVKRSALGSFQYLFDANNTSTNENPIRFYDDDTFDVSAFEGSSLYALRTTQVFRDVSAWYHFVVAFDTTQATASNRLKIYVNGTQITVFQTSTYPSQNTDYAINNNIAHAIGRWQGSPSRYLNGYLTEINFIDGQALTPSSFGETDTVTGVWTPKKYTGTYGTTGFYLNFSDNSGTTSTTLGKDSSGNGNNWTPNNFSVTAGAGNDSLVDSPTRYGTDTGAGGEVRGNYATLNPISNLSTGAALSNGNLDVVTQSSGDSSIPATIYVSSGKWYCEALINSVSAGTNALGIVPTTMPASTGPGYTATSYAYISSGNKANNSSQTAYGASYTTNDVIGIALDLDAGTLTFYKNGVSQGQAFSSISGTYTFAFGEYGSSSSGGYTTNFGQRPFAYTAPSGFKALVTTNLPASTIEDGGEYFNTVLYTGNGSTQSITGVGFQPDWVWIKSRSTTYNNNVFDSVRGVEKYLLTDSTLAENGGSSGTGSLTAFNSDGFSLGSQAYINNNTTTFVAWNWNAGGSTVTNTSGTISSQVRANPTAGFSILTYTGTGANATVGHGLGVAPAMVIVKDRTAGSSNDWGVWHRSLTSGAYYLRLNDTAGEAVAATYWNSTIPTSTVFSVGSSFNTNKSSNSYVGYCFAAVVGYSAFGSYTGNGNADGPFVYTGFRPACIILKSSSNSENWRIVDTTRSPQNTGSQDPTLYPNLNNAEGNTSDIDFLSNGFKWRETDTETNASGYTYIYMAFAENPFAYALAR